LKSVLENEELREETLPNRHRISLVLHLLRDPEPETVRGNETLVQGALRSFLDGKFTADEALEWLRPWVYGRQADFDLFSRVVLTRLKANVFGLQQAAWLIQGDGLASILPLTDLIDFLTEVLSKSDLSVNKTGRFLTNLLPNTEDYKALVEGGRTAAVHTERDILLQAFGKCPPDAAITAQLVRIIENHANEDLFLVLEAIRTLGASNAKDALAILLSYLNTETMSRYWDEIERSLQRICSGSELIPLSMYGLDFSSLKESDLEAIGGDDGGLPKIEHVYWQGQLGSLPDSPEAWFLHGRCLHPALNR